MMTTSNGRTNRYRVKVDEYIFYQQNGYLLVQNLVTPNALAELEQLASDYHEGRITATKASSGPLTRIHMIHRTQAVAERFLLYPPALDVLEALVGADVLALQTMLFLNPPDQGGQGWHQDAYYITTYPETLIGVWMAIDAADEENGCLWVVPGSHCEPIYPSPDRPAFIHEEDSFADLKTVENVSHLDDELNTLSKVAGKYPAPIPVPVNPGDVIFFHSHLLHRSHQNRSEKRLRRSFVSHYCNARSWVPWNHGAPFEGEAANHLHILARGWTHLPFAKPTFGAPCAALDSTPEQASSMRPSRMMAVNGDMEMMEEKGLDRSQIGVG